MNILSLLYNRYTTKAYDASFKIDEGRLSELTEALRFSPSSLNSQPWHFTLIGNQDVKEQLAQVSMHNIEKIRNCSHLLVFGVYARMKDFDAERVCGMTVEGYYRQNLEPHGEAFVKEWMTRQLYIALGQLLITCAQLGIDSTPMEGIDRAAYDLILKNEKFETVFAVALGRRDPLDVNQPSHTPKKRKQLSELLTRID